MSENYTDQSRVRWKDDSRPRGTDKVIELGCLQRIATSVETIALNHDTLVMQRDSARECRDYWRERALTAERSNSGLKGYITRLKKKLKSNPS